MKDNFFSSMLSEGGKISHKRFIAVICTAVVCFICIKVAVVHPQYIPDTLHSLLIFIGIMSGVATVAQVVSLVRGTPAPKDDEPKPPTT